MTWYIPGAPKWFKYWMNINHDGPKEFTKEPKEIRTNPIAILRIQSMTINDDKTCPAFDGWQLMTTNDHIYNAAPFQHTWVFSSNEYKLYQKTTDKQPMNLLHKESFHIFNSWLSGISIRWGLLSCQKKLLIHNEAIEFTCGGMKKPHVLMKIYLVTRSNYKITGSK